jgi:hypothetical protein
VRARRPLFLALALLVAPLGVVACSWNPSRPFEREAPLVNDAIKLLDGGGDATVAASTLEEYLSTGACKEGSIGLPDSVRRLPNGSFDLGLALFKVGETFGQRFGDEEVDAGRGPAAEDLHQKRAGQIACGLEIAQNIASDANAPLDLRAHARYLEGNLDFLGSDYEAAVKAYDQSIGLAPGFPDGGDPVGRNAAWNRAIALRRIEDQKDSGTDSGPPDGAAGDSGNPPPDGGGDGGKGDGGGSADASQPSPQPDGGDGEDAAAPPPPGPDSGPQLKPKENQDDRILDQLENAPTIQEESAKRRAQAHRRQRGMEDK